MCSPEPTTATQLEQRTFELVGEVAVVPAGGWASTDRSQLWRYHLHYLEWAWPLVQLPTDEGRGIFEQLWKDWHRSTRVGHWDAWSPYAVAVRAWTLCGLYEPLVEGTPYEDGYVESLQVHAGYVRANLELDVGGNHLMKNIKALVGLGVFFGDHALLDKGRQFLERELPVQVLPDGGHFERSPSYHAQVLGDLTDIAGLLDSAEATKPPGLPHAIDRMRHWLSHMLLPDGTVPLLKDCLPVSSGRLDALDIERLEHRDRCVDLADSGYVVVSTGRLHAVLDVGQPCPERLPAHAHADSLNWVLSIDGAPAIVDTGTSSYQNVDVRRHERSTAAHNTVEIDGENSTEVYGSFRAGRRANVSLQSVDDRAGGIHITAEHDGYRHLEASPRHRRTWTFTDDHVEIRDVVTGSGEHDLASHVHTVTPIAIDATPGRTTEATVDIGDGMGTTRTATRFTTALRTALPAHITTRIAPADTETDPGRPDAEAQATNPELPD